MKKKLLACLTFFAIMFLMVGHFSLEAKHHTRFSINVGAGFVSPQPAYVVANPCYAPVYVYQPYQPRVIVAPAPVYPTYPITVVSPAAKPVPRTQFSFGWSFWK